MALLHEERLKGVDERLANVVRLAGELSTDKGFDITVSEGLRTKGKQQQLFEAGKSKTLNSKHLTGEAVDLYPIRSNKIDCTGFGDVKECMEQASEHYQLPLTWGGSWKFQDKPHWEIKNLN